MRVDVERIVHGGYGLARLEEAVCLVPYSVPGDLLDIDGEWDGGVLFGRIRRIERPSRFRRVSKCPAFGLCGGCDYDNMDYDFELEVKRAILYEDLSRIAGIRGPDTGAAVVLSQYHYRNHAQFKVDDAGRIGFFRQRTREVVELPRSGCLLLQPSINEYVMSVRDKTRFLRGGFRVRSNADEVIFKKGIPGVQDDRYVFYSLGGLSYRVGIDDFFQVNTAVTVKWLQAIEASLDPFPEDTVFDIFCGSGLISIYLARRVKRVIGIEINPRAVQNAKENAVRNGITNVTFVRKDVAKGIATAEAGGKVILDPPRAGLSPRLISFVLQMRPSLIVYVSCDTATFARDVRRFADGGYGLLQVTMIDMFPRTKHLEVVARLERIT